MDEKEVAMAEDAKEQFETRCGLCLAIFAAILAITDLGAGKYGADEMIAHNEKTTALAWYNSKGVKETLLEGQRNILDAFLAAGAVKADQEGSVRAQIADLDKDIARYKKEKKEILNGSAAVGPEGYAQDIDGQLGKVIGAKEWERKAEALNAVGDRFDFAVLLLQVCLVVGALSLILKTPRVRQGFYWFLVVTGFSGLLVSITAFQMAGGV